MGVEMELDAHCEGRKSSLIKPCLDLALPGHFEVGWQPEAASAVRAG